MKKKIIIKPVLNCVAFASTLSVRAIIARLVYTSIDSITSELVMEMNPKKKRPSIGNETTKSRLDYQKARDEGDLKKTSTKMSRTCFFLLFSSFGTGFEYSTQYGRRFCRFGVFYFETFR